MTGWLTADAGELFGDGAVAQESYGLLTVDVPAASWTAALHTAHSELGCTYFDWLSAVDEPDTGFRVAAHVVALGPVRKLLLRTTVPHDAPVLASAVEVYAGAGWHERETHEMFGIDFEGHPHLTPLLLPDGFEGHPLRKDFVLAARVVKAWPGAKEPGESEHGGPRRRQMLPPGVPDPNEWGPHKGTLPAAPARPTRGARAATGETPAGERAPRGATRPTRERRPRRMRSASEGSASQSAQASRSGQESQAAQESSQAAQERRSVQESRSVQENQASQENRSSQSGARSTDAPWHHARPAFEEQRPDRPGYRDGAADEQATLRPPDDNGGDDNPSTTDLPDRETSDRETPGPDTPRGGPR